MLAESLEDLHRRWQRLGDEGFVRRHPGPFLVHLEDPPQGQQMAWVPLMNAPPGGKLLIPRANLLTQVYELVKVSGRGARNRLTLGRGPENDVVITERSISTVHATFEAAEDGAWRVADAGSKNGIRVNGTRSRQPEGAPLGSGDVVSAGDVPLAFVSTPDLIVYMQTWCA